MEYGWDSPDTAIFYERFCRRYSRYDTANRELIRRARLMPGHSVLDVAAGTGRTADAIVKQLHGSGSVTCFEPSKAMRTVGQSRRRDVLWTDSLPNGAYHRILCGAAIWQMQPLEETISRLARLLEPEGALCFNIPGLYLGTPGPSGPHQMPAGLTSRFAACSSTAMQPLPSPSDIDAILRAEGLTPVRWSVSPRLSQRAYCDWLKIPLLTNMLLGELDARERAIFVEAAFDSTPKSPSRNELWFGWTAWKMAPHETEPLRDSSPLLSRPDLLHERAAEDGYLFFHRLIAPQPICSLRKQVARLSGSLGWLARGTRWIEAVARPDVVVGAYDDPKWVTLQQHVFDLAEFKALRSNPEIHRCMMAVFDAPATHADGQVCRVFSPHAPDLTTLPHQDAFYLRRTPEFWTVWIPLGDCGHELGGLGVIRGSHRRGLLTHHGEPHGQHGVSLGPDTIWATADYCMGDVLMFHNRTVHRAFPNLTPDRLRLSADFRYIPAD